MQRSNTRYKHLAAKLLVIACLFPAHASLADEVQDAAIHQLSSDLIPHMRSTSRSVTLFNYSHGPSAAIQDEKILRQSIENSIASTWAALSTLKTRIIYTAGNGNKASGIPGFYTALDPVQSAEYGGKFSDWRMLVIQLAPSFKYLELGSSRSNDDALGMEAKMSDITRKALLDAGCDEKSSALLFISPKNAACAQIVAKTLRALSIQGILYPFGSSFTSVCPKQPFAAIIITDIQAIRAARIRSFVSMDFQKSPGLAELKILAEAAVLADKNSPNYKLVSERMGILANSATEGAAISWIDNNLFGCGSHAEEVDTGTMTPIVIN